MSAAQRLLIGLILLCAVGVGGYVAGDHNRNNAWLARQAVQAQAAVLALQAAQVRGDALTTALVASQAQIDQLKQEAHRAISTATTGRTCLDAAALRVLKHASGITLMPTAPGGAAAAPAPAASAAGNPAPDPAEPTDDTLSATDTQVAHWSVDAAAAYEVCRARLDALIDWHTRP